MKKYLQTQYWIYGMIGGSLSGQFIVWGVLYKFDPNKLLLCLVTAVAVMVLSVILIKIAGHFVK